MTSSVYTNLIYLILEYNMKLVSNKRLYVVHKTTAKMNAYFLHTLKICEIRIIAERQKRIIYKQAQTIRKK